VTIGDVGQAPWWQGAVIYQIYPRSFLDSNGDGIGDLPGIVSRLDYLASLGVDALWLSPVFPSPQADFGYDVSDYRAIDPRFGSMDDFRALLGAAHERGLRVILDLVLNHTSIEHPWFRESRSSPDNPKADWYLWADAEAGHPPNNWLSYFGGSAWEWDQARGQYYLHLFAREQPDLNWRNPEIERALFEVARFWLELGVDGFRLDVVNFLFKDALGRDEPPRRRQRSPIEYRNWHGVFRRDRPETLLLVERLRRLVDEYPERVTIGEVSTDYGVPQYLEYSKPGRLHLVFNFAFKNTPRYDLRAFRDGAARVEQIYGDLAWPCYVLGNHDTSRLITRFCDGPADVRRARVLVAMLLTLRGTAVLYQGDEIGMEQAKLPRERIVDPKGLNLWPLDHGRDGCRTPMQWDGSAHAGFSSVDPWLPVHENSDQVNVAAAERDPGSLLHWHRQLVRLRKVSPALRLGDFDWLVPEHGQVMAYERRLGSERKLVLLNFVDARVAIDLAAAGIADPGPVAFGSHRTEGASCGPRLDLEPYEVLVLDCAERTEG
jgi:alpha-glucosidase